MNNFPYSHTPDSQQLLDDWATWMRAQSWSENTIKERMFLIRRVAREAERSPEQLGKNDVLRFLSQKTFGAATRQTYYSSLCAWFSWVVQEEELREDNPMDKVRKPAAGRQQKRHLSTPHLEHLLSTRMHTRTRMMILLMAYQGLRAFEVAKFAGTDIDLRSKEVEVFGKGGVLAILPLHPVVEAQYGTFGDGWWFPQWTANKGSPSGGHILGGSVTRIVGDAMKRAGVPGSGHGLRHWHATELLRSGVDSRITMDLMRHASLETTQRYMHVDDTQRRAALQLLPDVTRRTTSRASAQPQGVMPPEELRDAA